MSWIVEISLRFRLLVAATAAGLLFVGVTQLRDMPVDVLPNSPRRMSRFRPKPWASPLRKSSN